MTLDALRQPLEEGAVRIARQGASLRFPASFLLVGCTNPCPCGRVPTECHCSEAQKGRYARRLSAPLLDRFDLRLRIAGPTAHDPPGEDSATVAARVAAGRRTPASALPRHALALEPGDSRTPRGPLRGDERRRALDAWRLVVEAGMLTGRGAQRIRRVARTIADLADAPLVEGEHVVLAASLRQDVP